MTKAQKEVIQAQLDNEKRCLDELRKIYNKALDDVNDKIAELVGRTDTENLQSIIYQRQYQEAIKKQISGILDAMNGEQFKSISDYLTASYEDGFIGNLYVLQQQGIPLIFPMDQKAVVRALTNDIKLSKGMYASLAEDVERLKKNAQGSLSRGIAQGSNYHDIALNIKSKMTGMYKDGGALYCAERIARTEGHRVQNQSQWDCLKKAQSKGADIVKEWDATLDDRTRSSHVKVDHEIRLLDEPFSNGLMMPGDKDGKPEEVINCRCVMLQRASWALTEHQDPDTGELTYTDGEFTKYSSFDGKIVDFSDVESYSDYKKKYMQVTRNGTEKPRVASDSEREAAAEALYKKMHPFEGKTYVMDPNGNLIEGVDDGIHTVYSLGDAELNTDAIINPDGSITVQNVDKLATDKTGKKFDEITFSKNDEGYFTEGAIKNEAQYKIDVENNKVLSLNSVSNNHQDYTQAILDALPADIKNDVDDLYNAFGGASSYDDCLKKVIKDRGYTGISINDFIDADTGEVTNGVFFLFDDSAVTKTKKSKLETLQTSLATQQKKLNKIDNKTYSGIWYNQDVSVSDYSAYKSKIQSKRDYYITQMGIETDPVKLAKYQKYLDDLDEFEKLGSQYEAIQSKITKIHADIIKFSPKNTSSNSKVFSDDAYSHSRKALAKSFDSRVAADKLHRPYLDSKWDTLDDKQKYAIWEYTHNSNPMNRPISGYDQRWDRTHFRGVGNVRWGNEDNYYHLGQKFSKFGSNGHPTYFSAISNLTTAIDHFELPDDLFLVRGSDLDGFAGLLEGKIISFDDAKKLLVSGDINTLRQKIINQSFQSHAFMSTATAKDSGFPGTVKYKIYTPKGTHGVYAEPQSFYGDTISNEEIYKKGKAYTSVGSEAEVILQRGSDYRITDIRKVGNDYLVEMEVVGQPDYFVYGDEETFNNGLTRHTS